VRRAAALIGLALWLTAPAPAQAPPDHAAIAQRLAEGFLAPQSAAFAKAAAAQVEAWQSACEGMDQSRLDGLQGQFAVTVQAYAAVEILPLDPLRADHRLERLSHWPERKNAIAKGMADLLKRAGAIDAKRLKEASAAAQGFSALERLLFEPDFMRRLSDVDGPPALSLKDVDRARLCAYGSAIAQSINMTATAIAAEWREPDNGARRALGEAASAKTMLARATTDILTALETIKDRKLKAPLGPMAGEERPTLMELWRSRLSLRQIDANLAAIDAIADLLLGAEAQTARTAIASARREIAPLLDRDPRDIPATERRRVLLVINLVATAQTDLADRLPAVLGVTAGFSSNDGD
jgi:uncharacterized protein